MYIVYVMYIAYIYMNIYIYIYEKTFNSKIQLVLE